MLELTFVLQSEYNTQNWAWIVSEWVLRPTCFTAKDNPKNLSPDHLVYILAAGQSSSFTQRHCCRQTGAVGIAVRCRRWDCVRRTVVQFLFFVTMLYIHSHLRLHLSDSFNWHKEFPTTIQGRVTWPARKDCKVQWVTVGVKGGP